MMPRLKLSVSCLAVMAAAASTGVVAQELGAGAEPNPVNAAPPEAAPVVEQASEPADTLVEGAAVPPVERKSQSRLVEEIIVTAQKREENIQDVPITIQAFSAESLDALGVKSTQDLQLVTPSLNFGEFVGYSIIFMRGVGTDAFLTADPSIATYVDGVYIPFSFGQSADFGSIDRVEVLKGPQGTLFGRNAVGGAISVYTKDPDTSNAFLDLSTSYGRFNDAQVKGTANLPVTDNFAIAFSGNYHRNDFIYDGSYGTDPSMAGKRGYGPEVSRGARVKALWNPTDDIDVMLAYAYNEFNGYSTSVTPVLQTTLAAYLLGSRAETKDYQADLTEAGLGYFSKMTYGRIGYHPGPFDIKLSGSHQYTGNYQFYDFDGTAAAIAEFNSTSTTGSGTDVDTAEIQFTSNTDTPFSDHLQWVAGGYYFKAQAGFRKPATLYLNSVDPATNLIDRLSDALSSSTALPGVTRLVSNLTGLAPTGRVGFTSGVGTDSKSAYAQGTYHFNDSIGLTLGGRYQVEKRDVNESGTWLELTSGDFLKVIDRRDQSATTKTFSPKISLEVRPIDGVLTYASYQEATKSGTYNAVNIYDAVDYVKPEKIKAYEVGAKTTLADGLRFNVSAWFYKQSDLQVQFVSLLKGGAVTFETAGAARSRGVEFDMNYLVLPDLVDDLVLIASGAYVDAKYTSYPGASGFSQIASPIPGVPLGILQQNLDFTGNRVPQAAKFTGTIQLNKAFALDSLDSNFEIGGDVYHNSGFFWTAQNVDASHEDAYTLVGAHASLLHNPSGVRVTAYGTNLTNVVHNLQVFTSDFGVVHHQASPVEYGLRVEFSFD